MRVLNSFALRIFAPEMPKQAKIEPGWGLEHPLWQRGYACTAGVDEAGRGALAGPVVAAAAILPFAEYPFNDSKKLSAVQRETLAEEVKLNALAWAVGQASAAEVDALNVLRATHLAAQRALATLSLSVDALVTDFLKLDFPGPVSAAAKGDAQSYQIAAASILAKTTRDRLMIRAANHYPAYGFAKHKGYGSAQHLAALDEHGLCPLHRKSFKPVAQRMAQGRLFT